MQRNHHASTSPNQAAINASWDELTARHRAERAELAQRTRQADPNDNNRYDNDDTAVSATPNPNDPHRAGDGSSTSDYHATGNYGGQIGKGGFGYGGNYSPDDDRRREVNRRAAQTDERAKHERGGR